MMRMMIRPYRRSTRVLGLACKTIFAAVLCALIITPALAAKNSISVHSAWMRLIIPSRPAAGYFTLNNDTDQAIRLVGATSKACGSLMLHRSSISKGMESMRAVKSLTVPAHGSASFAPGSYHLMCMSPAKGVSAGNTVAVTLKFADGKTITANFTVRGPSAQ